MLRMGCSKRDVTPDFPVMLHGYMRRNANTTAVENPIEVGVLVVEQGEKRVLFIMADMIGIYIDWCRKIRSSVGRKFGFAADDVWICASHSHFCPGFWDYMVLVEGNLPFGIKKNDGRYYDLWMRRLEEAIAEALGNMHEAELECAEIAVPGIAFNRRTIRKSDGLVETNYRWPIGHTDKFDFSPIDDRLSVWRFMADGKPLALLARFSCHPVTGGADMQAISGDYPGYFKRAVERLMDCPGFFMLGTAGDVVPMRRENSSREDIGEILARSIRLNDWKFVKCSDFTLTTDVLRVRCHISRLDGYDRSRREELWQEVVKRPHDSSTFVTDLVDMYRYAIAERFPDTDDPEIPVHLLRLGCKTLVGLPFEVLTKIGTDLAAACPDALIVSITGGYEGYLPLAFEYPRGGYEVYPGADFAPGTADAILTAVIKYLKESQQR